MLISTLLIIAIILISFSIHEFSHAWVANKLGDPTARLDGRLTLNPLAHWDPVGTSLLVGLLFLQGLGVPVFVFGWGKPVPVDDRYFKDPKNDFLKTSLAGPASNLAIAIILSLILRFFFSINSVAGDIIITSLTINIFLAIFNLLPVPPLDGSRVLQAILPEETYLQLEQFSPILMIGLIVILISFPQVLSSFVQNIVAFLIR